MVTLYALSKDENGLRCGADGLAYCGLALVAKSPRTGRFEVCEPGEILVTPPLLDQFYISMDLE